MAGARSHKFGPDHPWDDKDQVSPLERLLVVLGITALSWAVLALVVWAIWGLLAR